MPELYIVLSIVFLASLARSVFGFGDSLIGIPLLVLFIEFKTAVPLISGISASIAILMLFNSWRDIHISFAWRYILASIFGIPIGLYLLKYNFIKEITIALAVVTIIFPIIKLLRPGKVKVDSEWSTWLFGFTGGILGGACNTNGPPIIISSMLRKFPPNVFRATLQSYFLFTAVFIISGQIVTGLWNFDLLKLFLFSLPVMLMAFFFGKYLRRWIPLKKFERIICYLLIILGGMLLLQVFS